MLLILKKDEVQGPPDAIPTNDDMKVLRYYYYIHNGVDTIHASSINQSWLDHIMLIIPKKLKYWEEILSELLEEVKEEYVLCIKKSIVDFVLTDPAADNKGLKEYDSEDRRDAKRVCKEFGLTYQKVKLKLLKNLYLINPCIAQVLDLWHKQYLYVISFVIIIILNLIDMPFCNNNNNNFFYFFY